MSQNGVTVVLSIRTYCTVQESATSLKDLVRTGCTVLSTVVSTVLYLSPSQFSHGFDETGIKDHGWS